MAESGNPRLLTGVLWTTTYDEWLKLDTDARCAELRTWNPYQGENIHVPEEAARRAAARSALAVKRTSVGIYHCGEYILQLFVPESDLQNAPPFLETEFGGFRVAYLADADGSASRSAEAVGAVPSTAFFHRPHALRWWPTGATPMRPSLWTCPHT